MTWDDICADPRFRDYPGRVETNGQGQIIMSPAKNRHGLFQGRIARPLDRLMTGGEVFPECAIATTDGIKVADVAWADAAQVARLFDVAAWPESPAITVEVMSGSNTHEEKAGKRELYFERGAREFWLCDELGQVRFFDRDGELDRSRLCPAFPASVAPKS